MAATLRDIARETGMSLMTVSRVLQNRADVPVRPQTRECVLEAARRLGYQPNTMARALRAQATRQIVYVSSQAPGDVATDRYVGGVALHLARFGYRMVTGGGRRTARPAPTGLADLLEGYHCEVHPPRRQ